MSRHRSGFTLLEVALAIGVLSVGLTAVVSLYMVSLKWAEEIRIDLTALQSGRMALTDANIILNYDYTYSDHKNNDAVAKGYVNDYFIVRKYDTSKAVSLPNNLGQYGPVVVEVYYGGTDEDGRLVHELHGTQIIHKDYNP